MDLCASRLTASGKLTSPGLAHAGSHGTGLHRQCECNGGRTPFALESRCLGSHESPPGKSSPFFTMRPAYRSEEHTSELQSLMRISYAVFCLTKKKTHNQ